MNEIGPFAAAFFGLPPPPLEGLGFAVEDDRYLYSPSRPPRVLVGEIGETGASSFPRVVEFEEEVENIRETGVEGALLLPHDWEYGIWWDWGW